MKSERNIFSQKKLKIEKGNNEIRKGEHEKSAGDFNSLKGALMETENLGIGINDRIKNEYHMVEYFCERLS